MRWSATRTPLRDFVPGNLFDELLVPDVEFRVPWHRGDTHVEHLPALRSIGSSCLGTCLVISVFGPRISVTGYPLPHGMGCGWRTDDRRCELWWEHRSASSSVGKLPFVYSLRVRFNWTPCRPRSATRRHCGPDWSFAATVLGRGVRLPLRWGLFRACSKV